MNGTKYRDSSRSPSPYRRRQPDRSPSPYRRDRSRSPLPFRHDRDSRGSDNKNGPPKRKASPPRNARPEKRSVSDRSMMHSRRPHDTPDNNRQSGPQRDRDVRPEKSSSRRISYADTDQPPVVPSFHDNASQPAQSRSQTSNNEPKFKEGSKSLHTTTAGVKDIKLADKTETTVAHENLEDGIVLSVQEAVPSQESREEKRRRWAAMRAQHGSNSTDLRQQALLTNASETTTPNIGSPRIQEDSVSPAGSPRVPDMDSVPASPDVMVIDKEQVSSERGSPHPDSPSAANYDPMQDTLDDRIRAEQRIQQSGLSASAYDETNPQMLSTLPAEKAKPAKKKKKELDMFADSDEEEDDEANDEAQEDDVAQIAPAKGTVLDEKLLDNWDDPDGYYKIISNELVNSGRYRMIKPLGRGVFANVAQAEDVEEGSAQLVAIKIVRRNDAMKKASQKEMDFLRRLNETDPQDKRHIVRLLGSFDHKGHLCIVFEHLSKNLRDLLKEETSGHGLSLQAVKSYARQMFSGLKHLQDCQIIHADLKPDNILVSLDKKTIKLCDLGTAADKRDNSEPTPYLVSRFYRAPEIILGMDIGYAVDMWAIGCTVYELWTGKILFPGRSNNQMVKVIMECMGWPSEKLLKKGLLSGQHFEIGPPLTFVSKEVDQMGNPFVRKVEQKRMSSRPLKSRVQDAGRGITGNGPSATDLNDFVDLLGACLNWNYEKRIQPKEAINHKFFVKQPLAPRSAVVKPVLPKRGFIQRK